MLWPQLFTEFNEHSSCPKCIILRLYSVYYFLNGCRGALTPLIDLFPAMTPEHLVVTFESHPMEFLRLNGK